MYLGIFAKSEICKIFEHIRKTWEFTYISKALDEKNIEVIESGFDRIPMDTKTLSEDDQADVDKLLERLEEDDDVQNVFHNMAW